MIELNLEDRDELPAYIDIEELHIPIVLERKLRKTLVMTVTEEGILLIKAPIDIADKEIKRFLGQKRYWIYKQVKRKLENTSDRIVYSEGELKQLREKARRILTEKTQYYQSIIGVQCKCIRIGDQRTRWGSCSSKGTISYNWRITLMPDRIVNYVVVHELCHMIEMNHSKAFWGKVGQILPDYKDCRRWLRDNGNQYT